MKTFEIWEDENLDTSVVPKDLAGKDEICGSPRKLLHTFQAKNVNEARAAYNEFLGHDFEPPMMENGKPFYWDDAEFYD